MAIRPICLGAELSDPAKDYRAAARVEQYRVSEQAIYLPAFPGTRYLPFSAVAQAWIQDSSMPLTGCCGKELPVTVLRLRDRGGFYQNFTFEKRASAQRVLDAVTRSNPSVTGKGEG